jgi:hypothetical protein
MMVVLKIKSRNFPNDFSPHLKATTMMTTFEILGGKQM